MQQSVYYDVNNINSFHQQSDLNEKRVEELTQQLKLKEIQVNELTEEFKKQKTVLEAQILNLNNSSLIASTSIADAKDLEIKKLLVEVETLKKSLDDETAQNSELSVSLDKKTKFGENLSDLLEKSEQKNDLLKEEANEHFSTIKNLESELGKKIMNFYFKKKI